MARCLAVAVALISFCCLLGGGRADFIDGLIDDDASKPAASGAISKAKQEEMRQRARAETQILSMLQYNGLSCDGCTLEEMKAKLSADAAWRRTMQNIFVQGGELLAVLMVVGIAWFVAPPKQKP